MASLIPDSYFDDINRNNINPTTDTFKVMYLTNAASPSKTWAKRSDVTNEVAAGGGYNTGGFACTVAVQTLDTGNHRSDVQLGGATQSSSTITARYAAYYKSRGGAANLDELVFINDFGSDIASNNGTFTLNASTLRIQN